MSTKQKPNEDIALAYASICKPSGIAPVIAVPFSAQPRLETAPSVCRYCEDGFHIAHWITELGDFWAIQGGEKNRVQFGGNASDIEMFCDVVNYAAHTMKQTK